MLDSRNRKICEKKAQSLKRNRTQRKASSAESAYAVDMIVLPPLRVRRTATVLTTVILSDKVIIAVKCHNNLGGTVEYDTSSLFWDEVFLIFRVH